MDACSRRTRRSGHQQLDERLNVRRGASRGTWPQRSGDQRVATQAEQVAQYQQAIGADTILAIAINIERGTDVVETGLDRCWIGDGGVVGERIARQRTAGEASQIAGDQQTIGRTVVEIGGRALVDVEGGPRAPS